MKNVLIDNNIDESIKPVAMKHWRIPFQLRDKVKKEINRQLEADIIEKVDDRLIGFHQLLLAINVCA